MLLSGDVGGTNARLALFGHGAVRPELLVAHTYPTNEFPGLEAMVQRFCADQGLTPASIEGAAFGVAGPVLDNRVELTNASWRIDGAVVARALGIDAVTLVNDLLAMAWGVTVLDASELITLQEGVRDPHGNAALLAPGTGLGEALLHSLDGRLIPSASEGGHADFAPCTPRQIELLGHVTARFGRASYEHVISGPGLVTLYRFTHATPCPHVDLDGPHPAAGVTASAIARSCGRCVEALELFVEILGAEAGNHALRSVATGGVFLGGGIPSKILPALQDRRFLDAFLDKEPARALVARIPVHVIGHPDPGLLGAAVVAAGARPVASPRP
jgi:glucokinase